MRITGTFVAPNILIPDQPCPWPDGTRVTVKLIQVEDDGETTDDLDSDTDEPLIRHKSDT